MTTISRMLGAEAAPVVIEHAGKRYESRGVIQAIKSAWERDLQNAARAELAQVLPMLAPAAQTAMASDFLERVVGLEYSFFGPRSMAAMSTIEGVVRLTALLFAIDHDEAISLFLAKPVEVKLAVDQLMAEASAAAQALNAAAEKKEPDEGNGEAPA